MATVMTQTAFQSGPETPLSERTLTQSELGPTASIRSSTFSAVSQTQLLHQNVAGPITPAEQDDATRRGSDSTTRPGMPVLPHRRVPEDFTNPYIKQYVQESGYKPVSVFDALQRREMIARYRWKPQTDVGQALMECRDEDALQSVATSMKVGSWVERRSEFAMTDLHLAAAFGVLEVVDALLQLHSHHRFVPEDMLRKVPFEPFLPIDFAAAGDHVEVVARLLGTDASVDKASVTPLCFAVKSKAYGAIDLLLSHGADPLANCDYGSPLHRACKANDIVSVKALSSVMQQGKSTICSFQIYYPIPVAHPSLFGLWSTRLLHISVDPLGWAAFNGASDAVEILLAQGVRTDIEYDAVFISGGRRVTHATAMSLGAAKGYQRIVRLLLDHKPSSKFKDHAFAAAVCNREAQTARILSDAGARNSAVTKAWATMLGVEGISAKQSEEA